MRVIAGILAIIVAAVTGIMTFLNPNEKAALHRNAGNDYTALRNNTRIFRNIDHSQNLPEHDLYTRLIMLAKTRCFRLLSRLASLSGPGAQ